MENAAVASAAMAIPPAGKMRVLAVEEDPVGLTTLKQMLQRHGYQVTAKASPEEGLRALCDNPEGFDLVMTVAYTKGSGMDGFVLLRHAAKRYPVILLSGLDPAETMKRGMLGGASAFLTKPLRDEEVRDVWQHVVRRRLNAAASGAAAAIADAPSREVVVRQDETARRRGSAGLDDAGEGGSDGRTTKRNRFSSPSSELHASLVKAAEQLRGTEDYCPRGIQNLLEVQGIQVTIEQVKSHLEKHIRDCVNNHLSTMRTASSYPSNVSKNYSTPGSSGFYMRPQGTTNIHQTSPVSNGASPGGCGLLYNNGNRHGNNANGNFGLPSNLAQQVHQAMPEGHGNGRGGNGITAANGRNMVGASLPSNLSQQIKQARPPSSGNGHAGVSVNGSMVSASPPSNLAPKVHQAMPEGHGNGRAGIILAPNGDMVSASPPSNLSEPVKQARPPSSGNDRAGVSVNGSMVSASPPSNLAPQVHQVMPEGHGNGRAGIILAANGDMVIASPPSNLSEPVKQARPPSSGNGRAGVSVNGSMVSASPPSHGAPQVHQAMPEGHGNGRADIILAAKGNDMVSASPPPNLSQPVQQSRPTEQQEFPGVSRLRYDGSTGAITMMPWPPVAVDDDGEELLRSYLESDNKIMVMQNTESPADITQGVHGDGAAGQITASQPQDLTNPLCSDSSNGNGTAGTSGGSSGVVNEGILADCDFTADEIEKFCS